MYARIYAQIIGVVLLLVGVVGLVLGDQVWLGILNVAARIRPTTPPPAYRPRSCAAPCLGAL